jgi:hypothetical protein
LADREPYSAYADVSGSQSGSFVVLSGPAGLDEPAPDILVMPAEDFLCLRIHPRAEPSERTLYIPYGPVALMEQAFERGCADYLREPWALPELLARGIRFFKLKFHAGERKLELRGARLAGESAWIELTESERALLRLLVLNAPFPVPRKAAVSALSSRAQDGSQALGRCVISLRRKMELVEPGLGGRILAIRAIGYRLDALGCG